MLVRSTVQKSKVVSDEVMRKAQEYFKSYEKGDSDALRHLVLLLRKNKIEAEDVGIPQEKYRIMLRGILYDGN